MNGIGPGRAKKLCPTGQIAIEQAASYFNQKNDNSPTRCLQSGTSRSDLRINLRQQLRFKYRVKISLCRTPSESGGAKSVNRIALFLRSPDFKSGRCARRSRLPAQRVLHDRP